MPSKKLFLASTTVLFVLVSLLFIGSVEASSEMWSQTYGGEYGDITYSFDIAYSLVETSDGGFALAGYTSSFGAGDYDCWLVKTDAYGNMEWNKTYGGESSDAAYSLVETSDGGFAMAGQLANEFWLVKIDASGNMIWNQTYGEGSASSLVETSDGGYALAGETYIFGAGLFDFWLVKTDAYGNMEWNQTYGGEYGDIAHSLVETSDGGYALAGETYSFGAGASDFWLVKTDANGIPEFPSWTIIPLLLIATLAAIIYKQRLPKTSSA